MKILRRMLVLVLLGMSSFLIIMASMYFYARIQQKPIITKNSDILYYDRYGKEVNMGSTSENWIPLSDISPFLVDATIAIEDKNFYSHNGFDYLRLMKVSLLNIKNRRIVGGASTITQQYAKNLYLTFDKSWSRKINEAWYAILLETHYSKDEILEGYLNTINYGHGVYGIENASVFYFDKSASNLTLAEASILAGIPNRPEAYSPIKNEDLAKNRQKQVLDLMVKNKFITSDEADIAYDQNLSYLGKKDPLNLQTLKYFKDAVDKELQTIKSIPQTFLDSGGIKVYTTLSVNYQEKMEESIKEYLDDTELQTASILMNPNNGEVYALAGGKDFKASEFNRAIDSKRQVGSTMKGLLYYTALENDYNPSSRFISAETPFPYNNGMVYRPTNAGNKYANDEISMAEAIAVSDNIYAVKLHSLMGFDKLVNIAKRVGITADLQPVPSLALGSNEISLIEMTTAYSHFANEGHEVEPYFIRRVEDINGNVLYERPLYEPKQVLDKSITFVLNEMLRGMFDIRLNSYTPVTGIAIIPELTHFYAGKSGSSPTDSLMIGYTPNLIMSCWIGYDDMKKLENNSDFQLSKRIWAQTMEGILKGYNSGWYEQPEDVVGVLVDPISGEVATTTTRNSKIVYYLKGTEPLRDLYQDEILNNLIQPGEEESSKNE